MLAVPAERDTRSGKLSAIPVGDGTPWFSTSARHRRRSRRSGLRRLGPFRDVKALLINKSCRGVPRKPPADEGCFLTWGAVCPNHALAWEIRLGGSCSRRAGCLRFTGALRPLRLRLRKTPDGADLLRLPQSTSIHRAYLLPSMRFALQTGCSTRCVWSLPDPAAKPFSLG